MLKEQLQRDLFTEALESATLVDGKIYLNASKAAFENGLTLMFEGRPLSLRKLGKEPPPETTYSRGKAFEFYENRPTLHELSKKGAKLETKSKVYVNHLSDWVVDGCDTIQLEIGRTKEPHILQLEGSIEPLGSEIEPAFEAFVASHRCNGKIQIKFGAANQPPTSLEVEFDSSFKGGRSKNGFKHISVPFPYSPVGVKVGISVIYNEFVPEGGSSSSFVFIADPRVRDRRVADKILVPRHKRLGQAPKYSTYVASIPFLSSVSLSPIELELSGKRVNLFQPEELTVTVAENYGHSLQLVANKQRDSILFINGSACYPLKLSENQVLARLPDKYLTGDWIEVSIRDMSGSQSFLSFSFATPRLLTPEDVLISQSRPPYPTELSARAKFRYRSLGAHLRLPTVGLELNSIQIALETIEGDYSSVKLRQIAFPKVDKPAVSIIIPAHNKVEVTYYCLCALLLAHNETSFEVIVVDDGSLDETQELETIVSGIRVIHNEEPQRFIRSCNAGVKLAKGKYVVLLNNDTEPTVGWLDRLVESFGIFPNVGLVGSKLLYPDGSLQDAGGIVWGSGNPWNYGNRQNPWEPRFSYARQVDYLSGAAMMTTKKIWDEVGGLSKELEPMYFEDTDFAFKVREAGYRTYFVPSSVVFHFEGMTSGVDSTKGFKRYQEVNRPKFKRRWAKAFSGFGTEAQFPDLEKDRGIAGRVLFIDYTTPREDRDAGSYAARREIELVQSLGNKVTFLPQNLAHMGSYTEELERSGVEMIYAPFFLSLLEFLEKRAAEFDVVYITRYYVAQDTLHHIRRLAPKAKIILNNADLHFLRELRAAISENNPTRLEGVESIREQELEMMRKADVVLSYNQVEHSVINSHLNGQVKIMTCPWVVDVPEKIPSLERRSGLSFLGSFNHHPNVEGAKWFCKEVMPLLEGEDVHLSIYGSAINDAIKGLKTDSIDPVGYIENTLDAFDRHRIFVAPLLSGAGIKGKVLSAIAHGIPTVLTEVAAEGIGLKSGYDCIIASTPLEWVNGILILQNDDELWTAMSIAAREYARSQFSFENGKRKMKAIFEAVDLYAVI